MSRNLCETLCAQCGETVEMVETARQITEADCGRYFDEYQGMLVANAECRECGAKYLAWCYRPGHKVAWLAGGPGSYYTRPAMGEPDGLDFFDLSYRSTFNDEPGADDLPDPERFAKTRRGRWLAYRRVKLGELVDAGLAVDALSWEAQERFDVVLSVLFSMDIEVEFKKAVDT